MGRCLPREQATSGTELKGGTGKSRSQMLEKIGKREGRNERTDPLQKRRYCSASELSGPTGCIEGDTSVEGTSQLPKRRGKSAQKLRALGRVVFRRARRGHKEEESTWHGKLQGTNAMRKFRVWGGSKRSRQKRPAATFRVCDE